MIRRYDHLSVVVGETAEAAGAMAAASFAEGVQAALLGRDEIAVILATGNSQLGFVQALRERDDIEWDRITVMHMDEYLGMQSDHPASFRRWMQEQVVAEVHPAGFEGMKGDHEPVLEEIQRYSRLLRELSPVVTVMGIGENGHLAFNDPPADFETEELVRVVQMDEVSRRQQVGEGHFPSLDETPTHALSLTIPALLAAERVIVVTPEARKARIVKDALTGPISPWVPASWLRTQEHVTLFLDADSASLLPSAPEPRIRWN